MYRERVGEKAVQTDRQTDEGDTWSGGSRACEDKAPESHWDGPEGRIGPEIDSELWISEMKKFRVMVRLKE